MEWWMLVCLVMFCKVVLGGMVGDESGIVLKKLSG